MALAALQYRDAVQSKTKLSIVKRHLEDLYYTAMHRIASHTDIDQLGIDTQISEGLYQGNHLQVVLLSNAHVPCSSQYVWRVPTP
jgi:hypothetical protein